MKKIGAALLALMLLVTAGAAGAEESPAEVTEITVAGHSGAPEWADVRLNSRGFIDEGEYIFEDDENYVPLSAAELNRRTTRREYEKVLAGALEMGVENGFFQEGMTAEESFIPAFDTEGI